MLEEETPKREINGMWVILGGFLLFIIIVIMATKPKLLCGDGAIGAETDRWQIADTSLPDAEILWQRVDIPGLDTSGRANSKLAVSNSQVLIGRSNTLYICDTGNDIVAFNAATGEKNWNFAPIGGLHWIEAVDDGYLLLHGGDTRIIKLDNVGRPTWSSAQLPNRSVRILYTSGHNIYAPSINTLRTYMLVEGRSSVEIEDRLIRAVFDDLLIFRTDDGHLELVDPSTHETVGNLPLPKNIPINFTTPEINVSQVENLLLLFYGASQTDRIEALQIDTGEVVWSLDKYFNSVPILMDDKIFAYTFEDTLEIYNAINGSSIGRVTLKNTGLASSNVSQQNSSVWLSGRGNLVSILYRSNADLVAINFSQ